MNAVNYTLYLCTDEQIAPINQWPTIIEEAIKGGVTLVQLRMKHASTREFIDCARAVKSITDRYDVPLIINDRLDVAMAIDAHGLHVGQDDMEVAEVKKLWRQDKVVGVSVHTVEEAQEAVNRGADYLGVGAMFSTKTKEEAGVVSRDMLRFICESVSCPIVVIGGIKEENLASFSDQEIQGFAVVSAIMGKDNVSLAASRLRQRADKIVNQGGPLC